MLAMMRKTSISVNILFSYGSVLYFFLKKQGYNLSLT